MDPIILYACSAHSTAQLLSPFVRPFLPSPSPVSPNPPYQSRRARKSVLIFIHPQRIVGIKKARLNLSQSACFSIPVSQLAIFATFSYRKLECRVVTSCDAVSVSARIRIAFFYDAPTLHTHSLRSLPACNFRDSFRVKCSAPTRPPPPPQVAVSQSNQVLHSSPLLVLGVLMIFVPVRPSVASVRSFPSRSVTLPCAFTYFPSRRHRRSD